MNSFEWNPVFETGITDVDTQHHHLVDVINDFGDLLTEDHLTSDRIAVIFKELTEYADYHFRDEEILMKNIGLDMRHQESHSEVHSSFLTEVVNLAAESDDDTGAGLKHLLDFLIHWLAYHILGADQNMARQIVAIQSGSSPEEAYETEELQNGRFTEPLIVALNHLFDMVSSRNRELKQVNILLEQKVEHRTKELSEANRRLEELALTDVLTGLYNRRYALRALHTLWNESDVRKQTLTCLMIDADGFKVVNDTYGHDAGDEVLRVLSRTLAENLRTDDILCRLGGDEFFIICPSTDAVGGMKVADQLLSAVNNLRVPVGEKFWTGSISIGVGVQSPEMSNFEELVKMADLGVYAAKNAGRNCVRQAGKAVD